MKNLPIPILTLLVAGAYAGPSPAIENLDGEAAVALVEKIGGDKENLAVLDVRTAEEFAEGHISGAVQIDYLGDEFEKKLAALDRDRPYLVHCRSGRRSTGALEVMKKLGFKTIYHLDGGIKAWVAAGGETVKG